MSGATQICITQGFMSLHFMLVELIPPLKMGLKRLPLHAASILLSCFSMTTPIHQRQHTHTHTRKLIRTRARCKSKGQKVTYYGEVHDLEDPDS